MTPPRTTASSRSSLRQPLNRITLGASPPTPPSIPLRMPWKPALNISCPTHHRPRQQSRVRHRRPTTYRCRRLRPLRQRPGRLHHRLPSDPYYQNMSSSYGIADDTLTGSGVNTVQIALLDNLNNYWRTAGGWTSGGPCGGACNPWQTATSFIGDSSGTWTYSTLAGAFPSSNAQHPLYVRTLDRANNTPLPPPSPPALPPLRLASPSIRPAQHPP